MKKTIIILVFSLGFLACNPDNKPKANTGLLYFDLKGYFKNTALRLRKINPTVTKTIAIDAGMETRKLKIADWEKELTIFTNADINRTSWKGSFNVEKSGKTDNYTSDNRKIPVKRLTVTRKNGKIEKLELITSNNNILYTSADTLIYYPDSAYQIIKHQKIKLLKAKSYKISAIF